MSVSRFEEAVRKARHLAGKGEHFRVAELLSGVVDKAPDRGLAIEARYLLARSYAALGSYTRAMGEYDYVIAAGIAGPTDQRALYEAGLLHADQLNSPRAAVRLWEQYLARYPNGLFQEEVRYMLCETKAREGEPGTALSSCNDYLDRFPRGYRSSEALFISATLYRKHLRDSSRALDLYEKLLSRPGAKRKDEALYWKAGCLMMLHRDEDAAEALEQYLERFPRGARSGEARKLLDRLRSE